MRRAGHWTDVYRTDPHTIYETEAPIFANPDLTRQELDLVAALANELGTEIRSPVLDLACGPGRHGLALAERGFRVVGVDHSEGLLRIAATGASSILAERRPALVCADLRDLPLASEYFETALLLGKSFGYFSDERNRDLLAQVRAGLRPGGLLCVELPDREPYLASMEPVETVERRRATGETLRSEFSCRWDPGSRRLSVRETHVVLESGHELWQGDWDVRLYAAQEIVDLLREVGFTAVVARGTRLVEASGAKPDVLIVGAVR